MKLKEGYIIHEVEGEQVLVSCLPDGFSGLVRCNKTTAFIIEQLKRDTTKEEIVNTMLKEYDAPKDVIEKDVDKVISTLTGIGAFDD